MNCKDFLEEHGIATTSLREQIVEILEKSGVPISVNELVEKTGANKTTIYRNLELLKQKSLIITSENNLKIYYELSGHSKAYFVCESCHKMQEISMPNINQKRVNSVVVKGICDECVVE